MRRPARHDDLHRPGLPDRREARGGRRAARDRAAGAAPVDAPLEILETGVPVIVQMPGRFAWLDDDTLAITTFADAERQGAVDGAQDRRLRRARRARRSVLVPRGFVDCTNAGYNLREPGRSATSSRASRSARRAAPSVQQFDVWDPAARKLTPGAGRIQGRLAPVGLHEAGARGPAACTTSQGSKKPVRYLQPEHGTLVWGALDENGHPIGPTLVTPKKKVALALSDQRHLARRALAAVPQGLPAGAGRARPPARSAAQPAAGHDGSRRPHRAPRDPRGPGAPARRAEARRRRPR